jgi:hypothetical protein
MSRKKFNLFLMQKSPPWISKVGIGDLGGNPLESIPLYIFTECHEQIEHCKGE